MAKTAGTPLTFAEFINDIKVDLRHGYENHLRDAIPNSDLKGRLAPIPEGDKNLALIIRVDESDQIAKDDAVLVAET